MKSKKAFICQNCGQSYSKWTGRCQQCGEWNQIHEELVAGAKKQTVLSVSTDQEPRPVADIPTDQTSRQPSGYSELDNVLGGGLVPGSAVLLGGEPGIGKSTLLLQAAAAYAEKGVKLLYASGEESTAQISLRANRLGISSPTLLILSENNLEKIINWTDKTKPNILVVDSIQTIYSGELDSQPGSVSQLRECSHQLISLAKQQGLATFLIGHVTKEGAIAGPKVLEHMVDVVLYFEGTSNQTFRLLRSIKNRFGSTNELGVFEMAQEGMKQVTNPSELFLAERTTAIPGSVIAASQEGTRPILVEIQALVSQSALAMPRRTAIGMDPNRVSLLVAILEKRAGFRIFDQDVYINIAGGLRLNEPATDLAVLAAMVSSITAKPIDQESVFFGEVGLGGEIRSVPRAETRLKEAKRIGFRRAFVPKRVADELKQFEGLELIPLEHIGALTDYV